MPRRPGLSLLDPRPDPGRCRCRPPPPPPPRLQRRRAAGQRALEARFDSLLNAENLREWMKRLSARPHHVGSPYGKENAEFMAGLLPLLGLRREDRGVPRALPDAQGRACWRWWRPRASRPRSPSRALPEDATSGQTDEQLPTYNAYSIDGDVTGELVYVNYGVPDDYEELERRGIDVKGKIVIARYGGSWRGIKPKVAAEHGAVGCIIYSDPREDGYFQGDVYPKGGWRPERRRAARLGGGHADLPRRPADPGRRRDRGREAAGSSRRHDAHQDPGAADLLRRRAAAARGRSAARWRPSDWRGALPIPYHLGPGPAKVHLKLAFDWKLVPAYDVIATLPGSERPDQWIIRGNHHDAWVNGATDPMSGMVAVLEEARADGRAGARPAGGPKRTIVYAGWDGEEQGLLGSTEWVETHAAELREQGRRLHQLRQQPPRLPRRRRLAHAGGVRQRGRPRRAPIRRRASSVGERAARRADPRRRAPRSARRRATRAASRIDALGSGSDYTPFLQHLGDRLAQHRLRRRGRVRPVPLDLRLVRPLHALHGPGLRVRRRRWRRPTAGIVLRLANADVLPFEFAPPRPPPSARYVDEVREAGRTDSARRRRSATAGSTTKVYETVRRPHRDLGGAEAAGAGAAPQLRAAPERRGGPAEERRPPTAGLVARHGGRQAASPDARKKLDAILLRAERALTRKEGLPAPPLVPPPDLRARLLHRLRRQDPAGRARGHRAAQLAGGRRSRSASWRASSRATPRRSTGPRRCCRGDVKRSSPRAGDS